MPFRHFLLVTPNPSVSFDKGPYFYYVRKIVGGWVQQNAYNCLFSLGKQANLCLILLIMWVGGFKKRANCAYVIKVWPLMGK